MLLCVQGRYCHTRPATAFLNCLNRKNNSLPTKNMQVYCIHLRRYITLDDASLSLALLLSVGFNCFVCLFVCLLVCLFAGLLVCLCVCV